jgi:hypothetical protein
LDDLRVPSPRIERELPALQAGVQADYTSSAKNGSGGENCTPDFRGYEPGELLLLYAASNGTRPRS